MTGWISYYDKEPETNGHYLCYVDWVAHRILIWPPETLKDSRWDKRDSWFNVTHWMPLPKPPDDKP